MDIKSRIVINSILRLLPVLLCCQNLYTQSYTADIQKISVEDGLSNRFVFWIHKDSQGFIWITTQYGLNRYDGYTFKLYTKENSSLTDNEIYQISEHKNKKLWLFSSKIDILDLQTDSIQSFEQAFEGIAPFTTGDINAVYSDAQKNIWLLTSKKELYRYSNTQFEHVFSCPEALSEILYADDKHVWLREEKSIVLDMQGNMLKTFPLWGSQDIVNIDENGNFWLLQTQQRKLLQGSNNKVSIRQIDMDAIELPEDFYVPNLSRRVYINSADNLMWWYQQKQDSPPYFLVIHPQKGIVFNLYEKIKPFIAYGNLQLLGAFYVTENQAWIATSDGVFIITLKENKFTTLLSEIYSMRGIVEDNKGRVHINTASGKMLLDPEKGVQIRRGINELWLGAAKDSQGNLWFGSQYAIIEKYEPLSGKSHYYECPGDLTNSLPSERWTIIRDKTGKVWTGASRGLYSLEPETGRYQRFTQYNAFPGLGESIVYHLHEDKKGIWIASSSGLYLLEPGKGITARYAPGAAIPYRIPYEHILHFHRDIAGVFWLATSGGGLIRFNPEDGSYRQFTTADGLSNNIINAVYEDEYGKLWLPSNYGLMQFDKKTYRVKTYLKGDGIAHNEFNITSHYKATDGRLYFGGVAGVTVFHPKDFIAEDAIAPPLRITHCEILNSKTGELTNHTQTVINSNKLTLSPSDKSFTVEFALLNYENTRKNSYSYIIGGLDKDWTTIEENRLRINALPYGSYTLRIRGQGIKGESAANELSIPIFVNAPFYLKTGFIVSAVLALVLLVYGIFQWRLQNLKQAKTRLQETVKERTEEIRQQAAKLQELDKVKSRFFANISHELRTPLTLILGPLGSIASALKGKEKVAVKTISKPIEVIQRNGKQLLRLIEEILDLSKLDAHKLELHESPIAFYRYIKRLFSTFESHAAGRNIRYRLYYELPEDLQLLLDTNKVEKIILNYLSNAFKYSPDGADISLRLSAIDKTIRLSVQDNGQGIHPDDLPYVFDRFYQSGQSGVKAEGGTGIGLALCKELAELMGGLVDVESQWGKGSTFSCTLPKKEIIAPPLSPEQAEDTGSWEETGAQAEETTAIPSQKEHTILVVEDNDDMRDFIVSILRDHYHIRTAGDGEKALERLQEEKALPDLILSDVMMPRMDGFTLLEKVKSDRQWRTLPMIMLTARAAQQDKLQALTTGVDDYLTKPFDREELLVRIRNLLVNYSERKQWQQKESAKAALDTHFETEESWDTGWLRQAEEIVKHEMVNFKYKVSDLAAEMLISERHLLHKMKQITGLTPQEFIRELKLQKARALLENHVKNTIAEISYAVSFDTPGYFSKVYKNRFGKSPAEYLG